MKRFLCTSMVLILLLMGCSAPVQRPLPTNALGGDGYGVYEFDLSVENLSGRAFEGWEFVYTYNDKEIQSGHQMLFSLGVFSFQSIQVDVIEKENPKNTYRATFPIAICNGGSGETKITVAGRDGKTATFMVTCEITQVGKQQSVERKQII